MTYLQFLLVFLVPPILAGLFHFFRSDAEEKPLVVRGTFVLYHFGRHLHHPVG